MSTKNKVNQEIKVLTEAFPKEHGCFHIKSSGDELNCIFNIDHEKTHIFSVNILHYPKTAPICYTQSDEVILEEVLESLASNECQTITGRIKSVLTELCRIYNLQLPSEVTQLDITNSYLVDDLIDLDDLCHDLDDDNNNEVNCQDHLKLTDSDTDGLSEDQLELLSDIKDKIYEQSKTSSSSIVASNRLQKELQNIFKSDSYKNKSFTVKLVDDSLYQWHVRLMLSSFDADSPLYEDLVKLKNEKGAEASVEGILLHFVFSDNFPFDPPIVRIVEPAINRFEGGRVSKFGGDMNMELLSKQGWNPVYSIEAVILDVAVHLGRCKDRVEFKDLKDSSAAAA